MQTAAWHPKSPFSSRPRFIYRAAIAKKLVLTILPSPHKSTDKTLGRRSSSRRLPHNPPCWPKKQITTTWSTEVNRNCTSDSLVNRKSVLVLPRKIESKKHRIKNKRFIMTIITDCGYFSLQEVAALQEWRSIILQRDNIFFKFLSL